MKLFRTVLMSGLALAMCGGASEAPAAQAPAKMITLQMPATPDPARVTLEPKTTALIVLDYVEDICNHQVSCKTKMLPAMTPFMERVRKAGLTVAYGTRAQNQTKWLKEVAPAPGDIRITNTAQDRFYNTDLDKVSIRHRRLPRLLTIATGTSHDFLRGGTGMPRIGMERAARAEKKRSSRVVADSRSDRVCCTAGPGTAFRWI